MCYLREREHVRTSSELFEKSCFQACQQSLEDERKVSQDQNRERYQEDICLHSMFKSRQGRACLILAGLPLSSPVSFHLRNFACDKEVENI